MPYKLTRSLFTSRNLEVVSFLPTPTLLYQPTQTNRDDLNLSVVVNLSLIIRYTSGNSDRYDLDRSKRFVMSYRNWSATRKCFSSALKWFEDEAYNDIFYYTANGNLEFNLDRQGTRSVVELSKTSQYAMEIRPTVIENNLGRHEGISITINHKENTAFLDWQEFVLLADMVLNFNFESEALLLMQSYNFGSSMGNLMTPAEMRQARNIRSGSKPTPFD